MVDPAETAGEAVHRRRNCQGASFIANDEEIALPACPADFGRGHLRYGSNDPFQNPGAGHRAWHWLPL
jgi:hypothetical protein